VCSSDLPHTVRGTPTSRLSVPKSIACSLLREGFGWQRIIQGLLVVCGGARHLARLSVLTVVCSAYRTPKFWGRCTGLEWFGAIRIPTGGLSCMDMECAIVTVWSTVICKCTFSIIISSAIDMSCLTENTVASSL